MMCFCVLMVGIVSFVDHAVHAFLVADALSTNSPCVDIFQLDRLQSQNRVEQGVRKNMFAESYGLGTAWWVCDEFAGSVHN